MIVDALPHESVWREWLRTGGEGEEGEVAADLFVHAKRPEAVRSDWVRARLVGVTFRPEWNSVEVVQAMLAVLAAALRDGRAFQHFVFATESCLPLTTLRAAGEALLPPESGGGVRGSSWLDAYRVPRDRFDADAAFTAVDPAVVPRAAVCKCLPGWIAVQRAHAEEVVALTALLGGWGDEGGGEGLRWSERRPPATEPRALLDAWVGVHAPEEVFFPTALALLGYLRTDDGDGVVRRSVCFAEWPRIDAAHPARFARLDAALVGRMTAGGALFGRKFPPGACRRDQWLRAVGGEEETDKGNNNNNKAAVSDRKDHRKRQRRF